MRTSQGQVLRSLRSVQDFLDENAAAIGGVVNAGTRQKLDDAVAQLNNHVADQTGSGLAAQGATQKHHDLRKALLRDHMAPISRIARADLPHTPELEPLRMPRGRPGVETLASLAHGMAQAAAPFQDTFVQAGLPADFIARLENATTAMTASVDVRTSKRGSRGGATKGLQSSLSNGRRIVHVIDALLKSSLKDNPPLLAHWNIVKRVTRVGGGLAPIVAPTGQTPAPAPTPATGSTAPTPTT